MTAYQPPQLPLLRALLAPREQMQIARAAVPGPLPTTYTHDALVLGTTTLRRGTP